MSAAQAVAATLAGLGLLITGLSLHVSRLRLRHGVGLGDGGHKDLLVAMRAHGNALEQTSLFAVLALAAAVLVPVSAGLLMGCCLVFAVARLVHAGAMLGRRLRPRQAAHVASTLVHVVLAVAVLAAVGASA